MKSRPPPARLKQPASLDDLVHVVVKMMHGMTAELPLDQRVKVLDGVLQHVVQALNRWHEQQGGK